MDLCFLSFPLLLAFIPFLLMAVQIVKRPKPKANKLPPGPRKLPLIGNLHQLVGSTTHQCLRDLAKKHGPLMHLRLGEVSAVIVSSPEVAREVMKTHDVIFAHRPNFLAPRIMSYDATNIIFSPYGGYWRQLRKICTLELLSAKRVQSFRSIREEETSNLIKNIYSAKQSTLSLSEKIQSLTYGITARAAFGQKCKDQEAFISIMRRLTKVASGFSVADVYPSIETVSTLKGKLKKLHQETDQILESIIAEHKERKTDIKVGDIEVEENLLDVLLRLQCSDLEFHLSDNSLKAVILDTFSAGSESSATTLEWAMSEMLKNPEVMSRAQAEVRDIFDGKATVDEIGLQELKFMKLVIKETLRLHPPLPLIPRECSESCTLDGYEIPAKTRVFVNAWAIGRDPMHWNEPERFFPDRFLNSSIDYKGVNFEYIPFGAGRRICPGIIFGLASIELPLAKLLYHFDWQLPCGTKQEDLNMAEARGVTAARKEQLNVIPVPYQTFHG